MSGPETKTWLKHLIFQDFLCQMGERDYNVWVFFHGLFVDSKKKTLPVSLVHYLRRRHQWTTCYRREWFVLKDAVDDKILGHKTGSSSALVVPLNANLLPVSVLLSWFNFDKSVKEILRGRPGCKKREKERERGRERRKHGEEEIEEGVRRRGGPGVVYISCLLTWLCGQAANRTQRKEQVVLFLSASPARFSNPPSLSLFSFCPSLFFPLPSLPLSRLAQSRVQHFPLLTCSSTTLCSSTLSLFVLKG